MHFSKSYDAAIALLLEAADEIFKSKSAFYRVDALIDVFECYIKLKNYDRAKELEQQIDEEIKLDVNCESLMMKFME